MISYGDLVDMIGVQTDVIKSLHKPIRILSETVKIQTKHIEIQKNKIIDLENKIDFLCSLSSDNQKALSKITNLNRKDE